MEVYHETAAPTRTNPYAYTVVPPVGELLAIICEDRSVGGCFRPGNRRLADRMGYRSASQIPYLLSQLACDGWISYDPATGVIMLLRDPQSNEAISWTDRSAEQITSDDSDDDSGVIDPIDRDFEQQNAEYESDQSDRSNPQCMEDSCLAAADHDSDSAAASYKYHVPQKTISPPDHPDSRILLLSELGADDKIIADALSARPELSPEQIRASWAHFEPRIRAGLCTSGAFFSAIRRGQLHTAPPDPTRPLNPADYADDSLYKLGGDMTGSDPPPAPAEPPTESIRDRAARLVGAWTAENHQAQIRDSMFLQGRLGMGDSDEAALAALAVYRTAVRR